MSLFLVLHISPHNIVFNQTFHRNEQINSKMAIPISFFVQSDVL